VISRVSRPIRRKIAEWGSPSAGSEASEADIVELGDAAVERDMGSLPLKEPLAG
jgi:hypothetical protein